jgi:hypothetical protein
MDKRLRDLEDEEITRLYNQALSDLEVGDRESELARDKYLSDTLSLT